MYFSNVKHTVLAALGIMSITLCLMLVPSHAWAATSSWPSYTGGQASGAFSQAPTPTGDVDLSWSRSLANDMHTGVSDLILVDDDIVVASGDKLYRFDSQRGGRIAEASLAAPIGYASRILFAQNTIFVPLSEGRVQAFNADTLESLWVSDVMPEQQNLSTPVVFQDMILIATCDADASNSYSGFVRALDTATGQEVWTYDNGKRGFYWAGAIVVGNYAIIGDDAGVLHVFSSLGEEVTRLALPLSEKGLVTPIRSTLITNDTQDAIFAVSSDGTLHKVHVSSDGTLSIVKSVNFGASSTSTPVYVDGTVLVCGESHNGREMPWGSIKHYGLIVSIDAETMTVTYAIDTLDTGEPLTAEAKSTPLVSVQDGEVYAYFTVNDKPGSVYRYHLGDAAASVLYKPEGMQAQYCLSSVIAGSAGTLFYTNDSKTLFALDTAQAQQPEDPETPGNPETPGDSGDAHDDAMSGEGTQDGVAASTSTSSVVTMVPSQVVTSAAADTKASTASQADADSTKSGTAEADFNIQKASENSAKQAMDSDAKTDETDAPFTTMQLLAMAGIMTGIIGLIVGFVWLMRLRQRIAQ